MSFLPVSEALLRLEIEGLLESRPRAGTRVRIPSPEDVQGHYVVREALEVQAAMRFARVATPGERAELKKLAVRVDQLSMQLDRPLYQTVHQKLHARIAQCARCPALLDAIEKTHALASIWFCVMRQPKTEDPPTRHQELAEAVCSGDPAAGGGGGTAPSRGGGGALDGSAAAVFQAPEGHWPDVPSQRPEPAGPPRPLAVALKRLCLVTLDPGRVELCPCNGGVRPAVLASEESVRCEPSLLS